MQKILLFKIDYVCKIPPRGGAGSFLAYSLLVECQKNVIYFLIKMSMKRPLNYMILIIICVVFSAPHKFYIGFRYVNPLTEDSIEQMEK